MRAAVLAVLLASCRYHFDAIGTDATGDGSVMRTLEITVTGKGVVQGPGFACVDHCMVTVAGDVAVTATAAQPYQLASLGNCGAAASCTVGAAETQLAAVFTPLPITANVAFVTSMPTSIVSGRAALDTACANAATNGGLGGTFVAFVSTTAQSASARLVGSRGWVRLDGLPIIDTPADMGTLAVSRGVSFDENLQLVNNSIVTGSSSVGSTGVGETCGDWASAGTAVLRAYVGQGGLNAFGGAASTCGANEPVACFEVGRNVQVTIAPPPFPVGRYLFVTDGLFTPSGGISAADLLCATEAAAASLPGTYVALLATTTQAAADHLGSLAGPWRRVDDALVTLGTIESVLDTAPILTPSRTVIAAVFSGMSGGFHATGTTAATCTDWSATTSLNGQLMFSASVSPFTGIQGVSACTAAQHLLCAQQ